MPEARTMLEEALGGFAPPGEGPEAAVRRARRRQRNRRMGSAGLALAVVVAAAAFIVSAFLGGNRPVRPVHPSPTPAAPDSNGLLAFSVGSSVGSPQANGVYVTRPDGTGLRHLPLDAALGTGEVAWSPDGRRLAFAADDLSQHQRSELYVVAADGRNARRVTDTRVGVGLVAWSPDGRWIAFTGFLGGDRGIWGIFLVHPDGTGLHRILAGFDIGASSLVWGPTGRLAFVGSSRPTAANWCASPCGVWTANPDGSDPRLIVAQGREPANFVGTSLTVDAWSPDGRLLLVQNAPRHGDLAVVPAGGGSVRVLLRCPFTTCAVVPQSLMGAPTEYRTTISDAVWSPDGRTIAFILQGIGLRSRLYSMRASGTDIGQIRIPGRPSNVLSLSWQPLPAPGGR